MQVREELDRLGTRQHGLVTRSQLRGGGVTRGVLRGLIDTGRLITVHPGVYRLAGAPETWAQRVAAATLAGDGGAVASHRSAARLWGLGDHDEVEVTIPRSRNLRLGGVVVHRTEHGPVPFRRHGIPTTNPMRTLVDLGAVLAADEVEDALDRALVARLVTVAGVERELAGLARAGRSGAGVLRAVLHERALGTDRADGLLEPRMARLLRRHGLPPAVFQFEVWDRGRFVARIDFAYPHLRVALEVDGVDTHASPRALQADLERQNQLVALGWIVLRFTWADVVRRPDRVAAHVRRGLGARCEAG